VSTADPISRDEQQDEFHNFYKKWWLNEAKGNGILLFKSTFLNSHAFTEAEPPVYVILQKNAFGIFCKMYCLRPSADGLFMLR